MTGPGRSENETSPVARPSKTGLRDAPVAVVDDEVIGAPEPECPGREIELPLHGGNGEGRLPVFSCRKWSRRSLRVPSDNGWEASTARDQQAREYLSPNAADPRCS